jgi:hypothetical protein
MTSIVSSNPRQPADSSTPARLRLVLLALVVAAFFLVPTAQAAAAEHTLEVQVAGTGEGAVGCKVNAGPLEECEEEYEEGTEVSVFAEPEFGSEFVEWNGECDNVTGNECEVEMNGDKTVEVVFDLEEFELTVEAEGTGGGFVECQVDGGSYEPCPEAKTYPFGTEVTLYAEYEEGSEFVEWGGDCSGVEIECALTVEEPLSVTATFKPEPPFALTIETGGTGAGEVECAVEGEPAEECEEEYEEGTEVTVIAEPKPGSEFVEWNGECDSVAGNECEVEMNADKTVEAVFDGIPRTLTIAKAGTGSGEVKCKFNGGSAGACTSPQPNGTTVELIATAGAGSEFTGFSSGAGSATACSTSPCSFTIEANSAVTATFTAKAKEEAKKEEPKQTPEGTARAAATATVKSGKAELKLTCSGGPCKGTLQLTAKVKQGKKTKSLVIGKTSFSLAEGATTTLKVKLSGPAKQELAKGKALKAKTSGSGVTASTVKLKLAKKK